MWNIHSLSKKAASICDLVISKRIDILALTETWLTTLNTNNTTVAEILNTLRDYDFVHQPRTTGKGGGIGVLEWNIWIYLSPTTILLYD